MKAKELERLKILITQVSRQLDDLQDKYTKETGKKYIPYRLCYDKLVGIEVEIGQNTEEIQDTVRVSIIKECNKVKELLLLKNKEYGNSALSPIRIFSESDNIEQINVRVDDKLSRIKNKTEKIIKEDTILDLIGYLILLRIAKKEGKINETNKTKF